MKFSASEMYVSLALQSGQRASWGRVGLCFAQGSPEHTPLSYRKTPASAEFLLCAELRPRLFLYASSDSEGDLSFPIYR